jgi:glucose-1-phosphate cytidylyltransferase
MKVLILAGGFGTRISEESYLKPKPMIEIGEYPILVHIMKIYAAQGFDDFVILAGYKQRIIKEYFQNFGIYSNDVTFDFAKGTTILHKSSKYDWKVTILDTGLNTMTGGRILKAKEYIENEPFLLTYGDGVGDVDVNAAIASHKKSGKMATITVYNFGQAKGVVDIAKNGTIKAFREKSDLDGDLINIGFMVVNPEILNEIHSDKDVFESDVLQRLAPEGKINSYIHHGFWQCMDTMREKEKLEQLWNSGKAPWKVWKD